MKRLLVAPVAIASVLITGTVVHAAGFLATLSCGPNRREPFVTTVSFGSDLRGVRHTRRRDLVGRETYQIKVGADGTVVVTGQGGWEGEVGAWTYSLHGRATISGFSASGSQLNARAGNRACSMSAKASVLPERPVADSASKRKPLAESKSKERSAIKQRPVSEAKVTSSQIPSHANEPPNVLESAATKVARPGKPAQVAGVEAVGSQTVLQANDDRKSVSSTSSSDASKDKPAQVAEGADQNSGIPSGNTSPEQTTAFSMDRASEAHASAPIGNGPSGRMETSVIDTGPKGATSPQRQFAHLLSGNWLELENDRTTMWIDGEGRVWSPDGGFQGRIKEEVTEGGGNFLIANESSSCGYNVRWTRNFEAMHWALKSETKSKPDAKSCPKFTSFELLAGTRR